MSSRRVWRAGASRQTGLSIPGVCAELGCSGWPQTPTSGSGHLLLRAVRGGSHPWAGNLTYSSPSCWERGGCLEENNNKKAAEEGKGAG